MKPNKFLTVLSCFQTLFNFGDAVSFWGKFAAEKDEFKEKYSTLDHSDLFEGLSIEGLFRNANFLSTP